MAYNEKIADEIREIISQTFTDIEEKKMFGGLCFMVNGKMFIGVRAEKIMVRLDPALYEELMETEGCHPMNFTGKSIKGFVYVDIEAVNSRKKLEYWAGLAIAYNGRAKSAAKKKK